MTGCRSMSAPRSCVQPWGPRERCRDGAGGFPSGQKRRSLTESAHLSSAADPRGQEPAMGSVCGLAIAIVVPAVVLAGCANKKTPESAGEPSSTTSAQTVEPSATASIANQRSGVVPISRAGNQVSFQCAGTGEPVILLEAGDDTGGTEQYG